MIKLVYRMLIDAASEGSFAKNVFHYSYEEFKLKSQAYNPEGKLNSFTEMKLRDGRANSLHYKTGFAIAGFVDLLQKKIPTAYNALGQPVAFDNYEFELVESALDNQLLHIVAVHFITTRLLLHDTFGDYMILSVPPAAGQGFAAIPSTFVLKMQQALSVSEYQPITAYASFHQNSPAG